MNIALLTIGNICLLAAVAGFAFYYPSSIMADMRFLLILIIGFITVGLGIITPSLNSSVNLKQEEKPK